jgi:hypothetical protein
MCRNHFWLTFFCLWFVILSRPRAGAGVSNTRRNEVEPSKRVREVRT